MSQKFNAFEKRIKQIKLDLSKISEERWRATLSGKEKDIVKARIKAAEKTLDNCNALSKYVANFSTPLAKQILQREDEARKAFERVRATTDPKLLQEWVKEQLIPSTRFAERLGHMAASAIKKQETSEEFHRWERK